MRIKIKTITWCMRFALFLMCLFVPQGVWAEEGPRTYIGSLWDDYNDECIYELYSNDSLVIRTLDLDDTYEISVKALRYVDFRHSKKVTFVGNIKINSLESAFEGYEYLVEVNWGNLNINAVSNMSRMFKDCKNLKTLDLSPFNTANVTDMDYMFSGCTGLTSLTLSEFHMRGSYPLFNNNDKLDTLILKAIPYMVDEKLEGTLSDTIGLSLHEHFSGRTVICDLDEHSSVDYTKCSFYQEGTETQLPFITQCNHYCVKDGQCIACHGKNQTGTEGGCTWNIDMDGHLVIKPTTGNAGTLSDWGSGAPSWSSVSNRIQTVSTEGNIKAQTLKSAFQNCSHASSIDLAHLNTVGVTDMSQLLDSCKVLKSLTIGDFDMQQVATATNMFNGCSRLDTLDLRSVPFLMDGTFNTQFNGKTVKAQLDENSTIYSGTNYLPAVHPDYCNHYKTTNGICFFCNAESSSCGICLFADHADYIHTTGCSVGSLTYTRTFGSTAWTSWYVPFAMPVAELGTGVDAYAIENVRSYDDDEDGEADRSVLEVIKVTGGTLPASTPYIIYTREGGDMSISLQNITLDAASTNHPVVIETATKKYTFEGTYSQLAASAGRYAMADGALQTNVAVDPQRIYMTVSAKNNPYVDATANEAPMIRLQVVGEEDYETGIRTLYAAPREYSAEGIFNLNGQAQKSLQKGINIKNGKAVMMK